MSVTNSIISAFYSKRLRAIDRFRRQPWDVQFEQFRLLVSYGAGTEYFRRYGFGEFGSVEEFQQRIPVVGYDELQHEIERVRAGEENILWPGKVRWFAKSSGTTGDRSKYIPITRESLEQCHFRGGRDVMAVFAYQNPDSKAFDGKALTLGGSHRLDTMGAGAQSGDLSAILIRNAPRWVGMVREPSMEIALIPDFEQKVEAICRRCSRQRITSFAGVPSWNLVLMNRMLEYAGADNLLEVWPDLSLFIHGGVSFAPYREQYKRLIPSSRMKYMETYNASEGFFALQDNLSTPDMLLMLDYGIFYEFLPLKDLHEPERAVTLADVEMGVNYAMIISTNGGLWRYMIGDTVEFTSLSPYKIRITGRTKSYINAFGEEIIIDNAERAVAAASAATGARVRDYTAAPVFMEGRSKGGHEWFVEFETPPSDVMLFAEVLDKTLQEVNSDYAAKRFKNTTLMAPQLVVARQGAFYRWMQEREKLGGQNKVPRLANDRRYLDELLKINTL
ncbi:GH3 auxin-responsive promoter family protein [Rikenella microfusus]|uniref:GH3 auxin-responsive promoter family protein n=1 Tax=Rikenella microfusus TaxID=28139 RepID=UPI00248F3D8D|nr:GH3 auxin-responsive promoter family protein [Rikenella microfusus]